MSTKDQKKNSSFFSCCGCGDDEKNKEAYIDLSDKKPDQSLPSQLAFHYKIESPSKLVMAPPAPIIVKSTPTKPRVSFTYSSPTTTGSINQVTISQGPSSSVTQTTMVQGRSPRNNVNSGQQSFNEILIRGAPISSYQNVVKVSSDLTTDSKVKQDVKVAGEVVGQKLD